MDLDVISRHYEIISKHYPDMKVTQLGLVCICLGSLRAALGHEHAQGTIENYIHTQALSEDIRTCVDFLEREILGIKKSRIDIDYWKFGNTGSFRRNEDKIQE